MIDISNFQSIDLSVINCESKAVHKEGLLKIAVIKDNSSYISTLDVCNNNKLSISVIA